MAPAGLCRPPLKSALRGPEGPGGLFLGQTALAATGSPLPSEGGGRTGSGAPGQQGHCFQAPVHPEAAVRTKGSGVEASSSAGPAACRWPGITWILRL